MRNAGEECVFLDYDGVQAHMEWTVRYKKAMDTFLEMWETARVVEYVA